MPMFERNPIRLYHFTDTRNMASIKKLKGLHSWAELQRRLTDVAAPGGNQQSHEMDEAKGLDEYVHLCFTTQHPMEFRAREDGRIVRSTWLEIDRSILGWQGVLFTDDVSIKIGIETLTRKEASSAFDFEALCTRLDWKDPEQFARVKAVRRYEMLVPRYIPFDLIKAVG